MGTGSLDKPLAWVHGEVRTPPFSREARLEAGELLGRLQRGSSLAFPQARPMPVIGPGCLELRVKDRAHDWRILVHVAPDIIAILEVFSKKTRRTPRDVIERCQRRLRSFKTACK